ncbi:MAG: hypothetical protein LBI54_00400 [Lachnospiraceae bacterium]|jgi:hypothetical protein|nr:hypothetical protein [Lachnospiraceae bacterium]
MSRWEFMRRLEELLSDIAPSEREEALKYYNDYFQDGGTENEAKVLEALGTPEQVATTIKEGLEGQAGEFTEAGYKNNGEQNENPLTKYQKPGEQEKAKEKPPKSKMSAGTLALIIVLAILASPLIIALGAAALAVVIGLIGAAFGLIVAILAAILGLVCAVAAIAVICVVVGLALIPIGFFRLFSGVLTGLAIISAGLILGGTGLIFLLLAVLLVAKILPPLFRGVINLIKYIFTGKRGAKNA